MAIIALHSASTALSSLSQAIDVTANNLANAHTTGFKTSRVNFEDLLYQEKAQPGVENSNGDHSPAGLYVGLGTRISNTQLDFEQGSAIPTDREFDVLIDGPGFLRVDILEERGGGIGYTRAGNFHKNRDGDLVLGTTDGPRLADGINIPDDVFRIEISADGTVSGFTGTDTEASNLGQIELANFVNPEGLISIGGNVYIESAATGPPIVGVPGEGGFGTVLQKHLEASNVDPIKELIQLIKQQRAFEMNSQSIQAADEVLQVVGNLRRF